MHSSLTYFSSRRRMGIHLALIFALLMQSAIPLQSHTVFAKNDFGHLVVICTWNGARVEWIDLPGPDDASSVERLSPACLFSQLLASAGLSVAPTFPVALFVPFGALDEYRVAYFAVASLEAYLIRAPPDSVDRV